MLTLNRIWQSRSRWRHFFAAVATAVVVLLALDSAEQIHARRHLQQIANNAALAGVQALQDSAGWNETQRREAAVAASRALTDVSGARATVTASIAPIYVSVELSQSSGLLSRINGHLDVVGQAGYVPPAQSDSDEQARLYYRLDWKIVTARRD
jgi:uncharacterized membrane protein